jgi:hypothetical protein
MLSLYEAPNFGFRGDFHINSNVREAYIARCYKHVNQSFVLQLPTHFCVHKTPFCSHELVIIPFYYDW